MQLAGPKTHTKRQNSSKTARNSLSLTTLSVNLFAFNRLQRPLEGQLAWNQDFSQKQGRGGGEVTNCATQAGFPILVAPFVFAG
jgi:hypothetical protein